MQSKSERNLLNSELSFLHFQMMGDCNLFLSSIVSSHSYVSNYSIASTVHYTTLIRDSMAWSDAVERSSINGVVNVSRHYNQL